MPDTPFTFSPAGYIIDTDWGGPPKNGLGSMRPSIVTQLLPGAAVQARGHGQIPVGQLSGMHGTLEAYFMTGVAGTTRILAMLTDGAHGVIAIGVDATNQPFGLVTDLFGSTVSIVTLTLGTQPANIPMTVRLAWDSAVPTLVVETPAVAATSGQLTAPWTPFVPTSLWLGIGGSLIAYGDFNGTILKVQASDTVTVRATNINILEEVEFAHAAIRAMSTVATAAGVSPVFTGVLGSQFAMFAHVEPGL